MRPTTFRDADGLRLDSYIATVSTSCALEHYPVTAKLVCGQWNITAWDDSDPRYFGVNTGVVFLPHETSVYMACMHDYAAATEQTHNPLVQEMLAELAWLSEFTAAWEDYQ